MYAEQLMSTLGETSSESNLFVDGVDNTIVDVHVFYHTSTRLKGGASALHVGGQLSSSGNMISSSHDKVLEGLGLQSLEELLQPLQIAHCL